MPDNSLLGYWIRRFLMEYLVHERGLSRNTQQSYRDAFRLFLPYISSKIGIAVDRLAIEDISPDLVVAFLAHLETDRASTVITRNQRLATIHAFARFVAERTPEAIVWCSGIRSVPFKCHDRNLVPYLEKEEMDALLLAPDRCTRLGQRDHVMLLFLYNSGARASEAVRITIQDLSWDSAGSGSVRLDGKGRKVRFCPLWKKTMAELKPLIAGRAETSPVFVNRYGDAMTRFGLNALVERYVRLAGQKMPSLKKKRISPHTIRHTTATHLLRAGVDINTIRAWLGHVSINTTNVYAEADLAMKAKALAACDPGTHHNAHRKKWRDDPGLLEFLKEL
jgi:site-specific recombinase XerD